MGSALLRSHRAWLLKVVFVLATFATGLAMAGVVSGAGLSGLTTDTTDTESTVTETTDTTTEPTDTEPTEPAPTEPESTEPEPTEPPPAPNPPCAPTGDETLTADKAGYLPGAVVMLVGAGFGPSCDAQLRITLPDGTTSSDTISTDADGAFGTTYTLPAPAQPGEYVADALGALDTVLASATFEGLEPVAGTPFIWTDRDDYAPGSVFDLRGAGWLPGEAIQVVVDDDDGDTWLYTADIVAGADGTFVHQFQLPDWFVAVYTVTATGALSGTATTTFTDAIAFGGCGGTGFPGAPPHTIIVNTTVDEWNVGATTGNCSLREATRAANLDPAQDTIILPSNAAPYQLTRTGPGEDNTATGDLDVIHPVTISGGGARTTIVQAGPAPGAGIDRVFHVLSSGALVMSQTTIQFGTVNLEGGGIRLESSSNTALALTDVTVRDNSALTGKDGGGISAAANLTLQRVTISGNISSQHGGGLHVQGAANVLTNVTLTSNRATQQGGGIRTTAGTTTLTNVTVSHNTAAQGGGIRRDSGSINLRNTIVSDNIASSGAQCSGTVGNTSNNLDSGTTCGFGSTNASLSNATANLGALANNGGPTDTRALGTGSQAIDTGTSTAAPNHDQRSVTRPQGAAYDIGAFEAQAPANTAPTANPVTAATNEDTPVAITLSGSDAQTCELTFTIVSSPAHGTLGTLTNNTCTGPPNADTASVTYTPAANYNGPDSFTYRVTDAGGLNSNVATVTITVAPVDDPGTAANDTATVAEDSVANAIDVLANDNDPDGGTVVTAVTDPPRGTVVNNGTSVSYTPDPGYCNGGSPTDDFTYTITGGSTATVAVTVTCTNDAPVANGNSYSTDEDVTLNVPAPGVLGNDQDPENDPLTAVLDDDVDHGTLTLEANGSFSYTPSEDYCGGDSFTYHANDGDADSNVATVSLAVECINDAPVAEGDSYSTDEDTTLSVPAPGVLGNDDDEEGNALTAVLDADVAHGTLTLNADGSFSYAPDEDYCGDDSFTYHANDGAADSNVATVSLTVECVNDAPEAENDSYSTDEDTTLSVPAPGVLGNDSDPDGNSITVGAPRPLSGPAHGTLTLNADGSFEYTPNANFFGSDSFTYKATDGSADSNVATVTINVRPVNDAPNADDDAATVVEDSGANTILVLANDEDVDGDALVVSDVTQGAHGSVVNNGSSVSYTPNDDYCGPDTFAYTASDGNDGTDSATVSITVACVNDPPVARDDSYDATEDTTLSVNAANGVLANDTDVDGDALTAVLATDVAHGTLTLNADGSFTYAPTANYCGGDSFTYRAKDDSGEANDTSAPATVTIAVACVNDPPVARDDNYDATEDTTLSVNAANGVLANDTDVDGDALTAVLATDVAHGTLTLNADGSFTYAPTANYCGGDSFTYRAKDDSGEANDTSAPATVTIAVACVNDPPTVDAGGNASGDEGSPIALNGTVSDVEGDDFDVAWTFTPGAGTDPGASCTFAAATAEDTTITCTDDGTYTATLTAKDEHGASASDSTTVTVSNVDPEVTITTPNENTAPVSVGTVVTVSADFTDEGVNDTHTCSIAWGDGTTTPGTVTEEPQSGSGTCTGTHAYTVIGVHEITATVTDDDGGSGSDTAQIVVFDPNAGFVTGGGWVPVQPGSYTLNPAASGKGNFGFVSKYKNGASAPTGETEFNFNTAAFRFHSDTYKFLLVSGFKAQFVGTGSVNGEGGYDFRLTAYDGQVNGGGGVDRFRIKIRKNGVTVFDNRMTVASDDMETADPQALGGGAIVIHKGK